MLHALDTDGAEIGRAVEDLRETVLQLRECSARYAARDGGGGAADSDAQEVDREKIAILTDAVRRRAQRIGLSTDHLLARVNADIAIAGVLERMRQRVAA